MSSIGDGMVAVAFPVLALRATSSALAVALVSVAARLPMAVVALPAGVLADRVDRRRLVTAVNAARTAVLAGCGAALADGIGGLGLLCATAALLATGEVLVDVAVTASVPELVARDRLPAVSGYINAVDLSGESVVGPALGGLLVAVRAWVPFAADAGGFVAGTVLARRALACASPSDAVRASPGSAVPRSARADLWAGLALYRRTPALRTVAAVVGGFAACSTAVLAVLVVFAARRLGLGATGYGLLVAGAAVGDVVGSLLAGRAWRRAGPARSVLVAGAVAAAGYLVLSASTAVWVAAAALVVQALAVGIGTGAAVAVRQLATPPDMLGRSSAAYRLVVFSLLPLGALAGGALASAFGAATAIAAAGLVQLVVVALAARPLQRALVGLR